MGVFSFNGNKIITTSGGGMLVGTIRSLFGKRGSWHTGRDLRHTISIQQSDTTIG